jgi:phosphoribosylanthranilate isomerase
VGALGFTLGLPGGVHDGLTEDRARSIIRELPAEVMPVLITYANTAHDAARLARYIGAAAVQFHGGIIEGELLEFRQHCPLLRTIGCLTVSGKAAISEAKQFNEPLWDSLILDSLDARTGQRGATGLTHDWAISAEIVKQSPVPVILAGGLNPENVAEAIRRVHPHGVDAHTGLEESDGSRSFPKIRAFVSAALKAFEDY